MDKDFFKDKSVLIRDSGMSVSHAVRLAQDFGKVYYHVPQKPGFPEVHDFAKGYGFDNITKLTEEGTPIKFWSLADKVDLICFFDVGYSDHAAFLRRNRFNRVFSGVDILEEDRHFLKQVQEKLGLPTQKYIRVFGMTQLRTALKKAKNVYVKPMVFRGSRETFEVKDYDSVETILDNMEHEFGLMKEIIPFIIEKKVENVIVESGMDIFFNGKDYIRPYLIGVECETPYIGMFTNKPPKFAQKTMDAFRPVLEKLGYFGAMSTEEIVVSPTKSYFLDFTARFPQPLSSLYTLAIENYSEVIWKVAGGEEVEIIPRGQYVGSVSFESEYALKNPLRILYDSQYEENIKPIYGAKMDGKLYATRGFETVVNIVACEDTLQKVVNKIMKVLETVDADGLRKDLTNFKKAIEDFKKLEDLGLEME